MKLLPKKWSERLQQKLMGTPPYGRRRPQPNHDLWLTRIIYKFLGLE